MDKEFLHLVFPGLKDFDPNQPRDESGKWSDTGTDNESIHETKKPGSYSDLPDKERTESEIDVINASPDLKVISKGKFSGYHWTNSRAARVIDVEGMKGAPFDENLDLTVANERNLRDDGAIFAWPDSNFQGNVWGGGEEAVLYKITGQGYLVDHSDEGEMIIFRADQSDYERIET